jgi:hypothetical protein
MAADDESEKRLAMNGPVLVFEHAPDGTREPSPSLAQKARRLQRTRPEAYRVIEDLIDRLLSENLQSNRGA